MSVSVFETECEAWGIDSLRSPGSPEPKAKNKQRKSCRPATKVVECDGTSSRTGHEDC
jgi:hypothetical protein